MFTAFTNIYTPLDAMTFFSSFSFLSLSHGFGGYHTSVGLDVGLRNLQPFYSREGEEGEKRQHRIQIMFEKITTGLWVEGTGPLHQALFTNNDDFEGRFKQFI